VGLVGGWPVTVYDVLVLTTLMTLLVLVVTYWRTSRVEAPARQGRENSDDQH
jgi:hypothetical protein